MFKEEVFKLLEETAMRCRNQTYPIEMVVKWLACHKSLEKFKTKESSWMSMGVPFWKHCLWSYVHQFKKTQMMIQDGFNVTFKYWEV